MVWLLILSWSSSEFSCGSLNISHHLPRSIASCGDATFHPGASAKCTVDSLYAGAVDAGALGALYFGPGMHPTSTVASPAQTTATARAPACFRFPLFISDPNSTLIPRPRPRLD